MGTSLLCNHAKTHCFFIAVAEATIAALHGDGPGFVDHPDGAAPGALAREVRPLDENAAASDALLRLAVLTRVERYAEIAARTLVAFARRAEEAGPFGAGYASALARAMSSRASVVVVGTPRETAAMRNAARDLPDPHVSVRTIDPADAATLAEFGFEAGERPVAYVCRGARCAPPAHDAGSIAQAFAALS